MDFSFSNALMIKIDASLFAHIENDAKLKGTFGLMGNTFRVTGGYLSQYIDFLEATEQYLPPAYLKLNAKLKPFIKLSLELSTATTDALQTLAETMSERIFALRENDYLLLPGGWIKKDSNDNHALIYLFKREWNGWHFLVINSGAGLNNHPKKLDLDKEFYSPIMRWLLSSLTPEKNKAELSSFIYQLLLPLTQHLNTLTFNADNLYKEVFPRVSYLGGRLLPFELPMHVYTGGQLSGTCSQRSLHQLLKFLASASEYQRFIFNFKLFALDDFVNACLSNQVPFNEAVKTQIRFAIDHHFQLLNTFSHFSLPEKQALFMHLKELEKKLIHHPHSNLSSPRIQEDQKPYALTLKSTALIPSRLPETKHHEPLPLQSNFKTERSLKALKALETDYHTYLQQVKNPSFANRYFCMEKRVQCLPMPGRLEVEGFFSKELKTNKEMDECKIILDAIQNELIALTEECQQRFLPTLAIMQLSVLCLQIDLHDKHDERCGLPSFRAFTETIMRSLLKHLNVDPFWATSNPLWDQYFLVLQRRFSFFNYKPVETESDYYHYLNQLLETEPSLHQQLKLKYQKINLKPSERLLHEAIQKNELTGLFVFKDYLNTLKPAHEFLPLVNLLSQQLDYQAQIRRVINPFFQKKLFVNQRIGFSLHEENLLLRTALYPTHIPHQSRSSHIKKTRFTLTPSAAKDALAQDNTRRTKAYIHRLPPSANRIQLKDAKNGSVITHDHIMGRDFFHLRSNPEQQIALSIDYFIRHMALLSENNNQRYVEANLFQPGLLIKSFERPSFYDQFDRFIEASFFLFNKDGLYTQTSLFFVRLATLVNRYLVAFKPELGLRRLKQVQTQLEKEIPSNQELIIRYQLHEYLFLILITRLKEENQDEGILIKTWQSYRYLQNHRNPLVLNELTHQVDVEQALVFFQEKLTQLPESLRIKLIHDTADALRLSVINSEFPDYFLQDSDNKNIIINLLSGKQFIDGLCHQELPIGLQNHPLINYINLSTKQACLGDKNAEKSLFYFHKDESQARLLLQGNKLIIQKKWTINHSPADYELKGLNKQHLVCRYNNPPLASSLPTILRKEYATVFWQEINSLTRGLIAHRNQALYVLNNANYQRLNSQGEATDYSLIPLPAPCQKSLCTFESRDFILAHSNGKKLSIHLPRYDFHLSADLGDLSKICLEETGEYLQNRLSPIHPSVAGLLLARDEHARYLVSVSPFYATDEHSRIADYYHVVHDKHHVIAKHLVQQHWKAFPPQHRPLWTYYGTKQWVSFRLEKDTPIADNVGDALYLAYLYLATHQADKAWTTLDDCNRLFCGLTGELRELEYLYWICKALPYHITHLTSKDPTHKTSSFVACQLKALSLLSDYLAQDKSYHIPKSFHDETANAVYENLRENYLTGFLTNLAQTIYRSFQRFHALQRHLTHPYDLLPSEQTSLLQYYYQSTKLKPTGVLGKRWKTLRLEGLKQQQNALQQQEAVSATDSKRLRFIDKQLTHLPPVSAKHSVIDDTPIDLSLAKASLVLSHLKPQSLVLIQQWEQTLFHNDSLVNPQGVLNQLSSQINDDDFFRLFPHLILIAAGSEQKEKDSLGDFCQKTLIANRYKPSSNLTLLCNLLYRITHYRLKLPSLEKKFSLLLSKLAKYPDPPLTAASLAETVTPQEIETPVPKAVPPLSLPPSIEKNQAWISLQSHLAKKTSRRITQLIKEFHRLEEDTSHLLSDLGKQHPSDRQQAFIVEKKAGSYLFEKEQQQKKIAGNIFQDRDLLEQLQKASVQAKKSLSQEKDLAWQQALSFAKTCRNTSENALCLKIQRRAKRSPKLSQAQLITLYTQGDSTSYQQALGLEWQQAEDLHYLIHKALIAGIHSQMADKINASLCSLKEDPNEELAYHLLALLAKKELLGVDRKSTVIMQHQEGILLYPQQVKSLNNLLTRFRADKPIEFVEKIPPGRGKTKVGGPLNAEELADGIHLVIFEVPATHLATCHADLNRSSQRLFQKRAYRFEFNRHSPCSAMHLEQLYSFFTDIIVRRCYVVTASESIQSLSLKYHELLLEENEQNNEWQQQIFWFDKLTKLLRYQAIAIIDEAHQGLWINQQLNYPIGAPVSLDPSLIENNLALFSLIDLRFIQQAAQFGKDYDWQPFKHELSYRLMTAVTSPLHAFVSRVSATYGREAREAVLAYLRGEDTCVRAFIPEITEEEQALLDFCTNQINTFLPQTLSSKLNVKYGASRQKGLKPIQYTLAIPYASNNSPKENNRFGVVLAINYTIQMMYIKGVSQELLAIEIGHWKTIAQQQKFTNSLLKSIDETPFAQGLRLAYPDIDLPLSQINESDSLQMAALHKKLQFNRPLINAILGQSLGQITHDKTILFSNNINRIESYYYVYGMSGTPNNYQTFNPRLSFNPLPSLGSDGYLLAVLNHKKMPIQGIDYLNLKQFVRDAFEQSLEKKHTRVIIDVNASFTGQSNLLVARNIARFIQQHPEHFSTSLHYVLYFNAKEELCALDVKNPGTIIWLGTSDEEVISSLLNITPNQRFTYYDQKHTLGIDIKQDPKAHALLLIDEYCTLQTYIQGQHRMRGLTSTQSSEVIVPTRLMALSQEALHNKLEQTEEEALLPDILNAGKAALLNHLRQRVDSYIHHLPSKDAINKAKIAQHFKAFFVMCSSLNLYALYGQSRQKIDTRTILIRYKIHLLAAWNKASQSKHLPLPEEIEGAMDSQLQQIIETILPFCAKDYEETAHYPVAEVETQNQIHHEKQTEKQTFTLQQEYQEASLLFWPKDMPAFSSVVENHTLALNDLFIEKGRQGFFSETLRLSKNYAQTHTQHALGYLDVFLKPAFMIWYHYVEQVLHAIIITPQEAKDMSIPASDWLLTTEGTVLTNGPSQSLMKDPQYPLLCEQIRFFNGELQSFIDQKTPIVWLNTDLSEKMAFFTEYLLPYRPGNEEILPVLNELGKTPSPLGFEHLAHHPFENHSLRTWTRRYPHFSPLHLKEYQHLAEAFLYLNDAWLNEPIDNQALRETFNLHPSSLPYLQQHRESLSTLKTIIHALSRLSPDGLSQLDEQKKQCLESHLGKSLDELIAAHQTIEQGERLAQLKVLSLLNQHPALQGKTAIIEIYLTMINEENSPLILSTLIDLLPSSDGLCSVLDKLLTKRGQDDPKVGDALLIQFVHRHLQQKPLAESILSTLKKHLPDATLEYLLFPALNRAITPYLSLPAILTLLDNASEETLDVLLTLPKPQPNDVLRMLLKQCQTTKQWLSFLQRDDLSPELLHQCFLQTPSFEVMQQLFTHSAIDKKQVKQWYQAARDEYQAVKQQSLHSDNKELVYLSHLQALSLKAREHARDAIHNRSYEPAAFTALHLHQQLSQLFKAYKSNRLSFDVFQQKTEAAIREALPVLSTHRGYKQAFVDILNALLFIITGRFLQKETHWRFFTVKTASEEISHELLMQSSSPLFGA